MWLREERLGGGSFGDVFLEKKEVEGEQDELRAVKVVTKSVPKNGKGKKVNHIAEDEDEVYAMASMAKVRNPVRNLRSPRIKGDRWIA